MRHDNKMHQFYKRQRVIDLIDNTLAERCKKENLRHFV